MKGTAAMRATARIAETQDGLVTTSQAVRIGVPRLSLARLADSGDLERLTHGVYRVRGADPDEHTALRAAWLAVDPDRTAAERAADLGHPIVVSHRSAAAVHGIGNMYADHHEMTAPVRKQTRRPGLVMHRADIPRSDITIARGMLVTTIERTLADLARTEPELGDVADVLADAHRRGAVDLERLAPMLDAAARRHGSRDGAELLERMLELSGLDAGSVVRRLAGLPAVQEALARVWSPAIQSLVASAYANQHLTEVAASVAASKHPTPPPNLDGVLPDLSALVEPLAQAAASARGLEALQAQFVSPSLRMALSNFASVQRVFDDAWRTLESGPPVEAPGAIQDRGNE